MGSTCVVGLQWGDEAKGKIVDLLCDHHQVVVRYQGGANAGHTVVHEGTTYKLSLIPTGILRQGVECVIGNGVVIHPASLLSEIERLSSQGVDFGGRLHISERAHVIFPYHMAEERLSEESASVADHIGTTRRGIGPCYRDKVGRMHGVRIADLYHPAEFRERLARIVDFKNRLLRSMLADFEPFDAASMAEEYLAHAETLRPFVRDTTAWLHAAIRGGRKLLFEGAQGSLLDIDHGSYPYVTSSNSSAAGAAAGSGVPTRHIDRWIGVVKAYTTRVGGGPFPTEQENETGERIRRVGREYGTVTGRPRRCGWFDAVAVRYSSAVSGSTELAIMLLDVLSGIEELRVAVAYEIDGVRVPSLPASLTDLARCVPVYETLPGWSEDITGAREWADLPRAARDYVAFIARQVGVPASIVSVGPDRRQTIQIPECDRPSA
ncbi:Adenylosuccinate synthetase [Aquisphaera giovannonii]|uniref:Adenylosuccinate synthetase n=1 Tax=Aquisphaera giovannonii TaxID=406548 RepID=A0A5B9VYP3_9BACT|nr:adenylosuccinate synthase [Aquisphaera giovannonii]QEH33463.1 Adenylosuccinate synthetase [Aquisphaera giovannonii]